MEMGYRLQGHLIVVAHTAAAPSAAEWSDYVKAIQKVLSHAPGEEIRTVVFTDGGGPDASQRKSLTEVPGWNAVRVSVISSNPKVRGIVTAFSWFNSRMKAFLPEAKSEAMKHLDLSPDDESRVWSIAQELHAVFGPGRVKTLTAALGPAGEPAAKQA